MLVNWILLVQPHHARHVVLVPADPRHLVPDRAFGVLVGLVLQKPPTAPLLAIRGGGRVVFAGGCVAFVNGFVGGGGVVVAIVVVVVVVVVFAPPRCSGADCI